MNDLLNIKANNERITLSARELHKFLEVGTEFRHWFPRMCEYGFVEEIDYTPVIFDHPLNGQPTTDYQITIEMAKEISMIQRSEKGKQARQYFIQLEKEWNTPERVMARGLIASQKVIEELNTKLLEVKPKIEFFDAVASSKSAIPMDQVAKVIDIKGIGRNKLFEILRNNKILQLNNVPYQKYVDRGYFRVIESKFNKPNGEVAISIKTLVYQKGVEYIRKLLEKGQVYD